MCEKFDFPYKETFIFNEKFDLPYNSIFESKAKQNKNSVVTSVVTKEKSVKSTSQHAAWQQTNRGKDPRTPRIS